MSLKLTEIYQSILRYSGLDADEQGYISTVLDEKRDPAFINGLRLVLPSDYHLRSFNPKEKIIFHPLTENILRGESEVIVKLKSVINIRLNFTIGIIAQSLLNLVASPEYHNKLSPEQAELLTSITDADDKTVSNFISLMVNGIKTAPERLFTNIYLKRGGTLNGKRHSRVGIVSFPFYQNLIDDKVEKIRVKDKETFKQLFEFIFPGLKDSEEYNFGSDSHVAPYLEALMRSSANIASRLNDIILMYKDYIEDSEKLSFDSEWMEYFQDLNALIPEIRKVPVQFGNDGSVSITEEQQVPVTTAPAYQPQQTQYPQTPQYQPPPVPEIRKTKHGLDFQSVAQANPGVAMAPNALMPQMMREQYMQQMAHAQAQQPSWAGQPQPGMMPMQMPQMPQMPMQLPPGVVMSPQGPMVQTPQGWMPYNPQMMQQPGMAPNPSWSAPPQPQYGYGYRG